MCSISGQEKWHFKDFIKDEWFDEIGAACLDIVLVILTGINPFMPTDAFNICCPRDCVTQHNGGTSGAPLKPLRVDSALRALSTLRGLRGAPEVPPLRRETQSLGQQMLERWEQMGCRIDFVLDHIAYKYYNYLYY